MKDGRTIFSKYLSMSLDSQIILFIFFLQDFKEVFIGVELIYSVVLVSGVQ